MNSLTLLSPAKLNLFLKVNFQRPDGFHDITTLFERVDLCDEISYRATCSSDIGISCNDKDVPTGPKNLIHKVGRLLQEELGVRQGVVVRIKKRIPVAAGMAGGSSNAATTLLALNKVWALNLPRQDLVAFAKRIGSDVAFFLYDTSWALGSERGDRIRPLQLKPRFWHVVVTPRVKLYSGDVYGALKLQLTNKKANVNILLHNLRNYNIWGIGSFLENDLEKAVFSLCPQLEKLTQKLKLLGAKGVMVSGSGPSVFGLVQNESDAKRIAQVVSCRYARVFIVKTL